MMSLQSHSHLTCQPEVATQAWSWYKSLLQFAPLSLHMSSPFGIDRKKYTIQARREKTLRVAQSCSLFCPKKKVHINVKVEAMH